MRKFVPIGAATLALVAAAPAAADPPAENDHNCAGALVSTVAGPAFGQIASTAAHFQAIDNFGLANCGQTNRKNP